METRLAPCRSLQFVNRADPITETIARKIIEIAGTGERDPELICELILLALNEFRRAQRVSNQLCIVNFRACEAKSTRPTLARSCLRFRAQALRAISSPPFFPNAALSNGAMSFVAPNRATSRSTLALCFDGAISPRCGMGHHCIPKRNVAKPARFPNLARTRNDKMS